MLLDQVEQLLGVLRIFERGPMVYGIATLFLTQLYLLTALLAYVVARRLIRMTSRWRNEVRHLNHLREIFAYVISKQQVVVRVPWYERQFFRRLILSQMTVMEGDDFKALQQLYRECGYDAEDLRSIKSRLWWRRLAALVRLEQCRLPESREWIAPLIEDPNQFVALVALRAICPLSKPSQIVEILDALSRRAPDRRDLYVEILESLAEDHVESVIRYLETCFDPQIASICVDVLGNLKAVEAAPLVTRLVKSSDPLVVASAVRALGSLGVVTEISSIRSLLSHEVPAVRAQALRALHQLGDSRIVWSVRDCEGDRDPEVRRAVFEIQSSLGGDSLRG